MNDAIEKKGRVKSPSKFSQVAINEDAIKVLDELIKLEGSNRMGGRSLSRADVLNDLLMKGAKKLRDFYYSEI